MTLKEAIKMVKGPLLIRGGPPHHAESPRLARPRGSRAPSNRRASRSSVNWETAYARVLRSAAKRNGSGASAAPRSQNVSPWVTVWTGGALGRRTAVPRRPVAVGDLLEILGRAWSCLLSPRGGRRPSDRRPRRVADSPPGTASSCCALAFSTFTRRLVRGESRAARGGAGGETQAARPLRPAATPRAGMDREGRMTTNFDAHLHLTSPPDGAVSHRRGHTEPAEQRGRFCVP